MSWDTTHINNKLRVSSMPYLYDIAEGNVLNHSPIRIFAQNSTQTTNLVAISQLGTLIDYPSVAVAAKVSVKATLSSDSSAGNRERTVKITGLEASFDEIYDNVTLSGATAIKSALNFIRVFEAEVMTAGNLNGNKGKISVTSTDTASDYLQINAQQNVSLVGRYTVPRGKTLYITNLDFSEASNKGASVSLWTKASTSGIWKIKRVYSIYQSHVNVALLMPYAVSEKYDVELRAQAVTDASNISASIIGWSET